MQKQLEMKETCPLKNFLKLLILCILSEFVLGCAEYLGGVSGGGGGGAPGGRSLRQHIL